MTPQEKHTESDPLARLRRLVSLEDLPQRDDIRPVMQILGSEPRTSGGFRLTDR